MFAVKLLHNVAILALGHKFTGSYCNLYYVSQWGVFEEQVGAHYDLCWRADTIWLFRHHKCTGFSGGWGFTVWEAGPSGWHPHTTASRYHCIGKSRQCQTTTLWSKAKTHISRAVRFVDFKSGFPQILSYISTFLVICHWQYLLQTNIVQINVIIYSPTPQYSNEGHIDASGQWHADVIFLLRHTVSYHVRTYACTLHNTGVRKGR